MRNPTTPGTFVAAPIPIDDVADDDDDEDDDDDIKILVDEDNDNDDDDTVANVDTHGNVNMGTSCSAN